MGDGNGIVSDDDVEFEAQNHGNREVNDRKWVQSRDQMRLCECAKLSSNIQTHQTIYGISGSNWTDR